MAASSPVLPFFAVFFIAALVLNWIWEMGQMFAYIGMRDQPLVELVLFCTSASIGDAVLTLLAYGLGTLFTRSLSWGIRGGWKGYLTLAICGTVFALVIEWIAKALGYWTYSERMPIVPLVKVGLLPLLQLTILVPAALWLAVRWHKYPGNVADDGRDGGRNGIAMAEVGRAVRFINVLFGGWLV